MAQAPPQLRLRSAPSVELADTTPRRGALHPAAASHAAQAELMQKLHKLRPHRVLRAQAVGINHQSVSLNAFPGKTALLGTAEKETRLITVR